MEIHPRRSIHERRSLEKFITNEQQENQQNSFGDLVIDDDGDYFNSEEDEEIFNNSQKCLIEEENRFNSQRVRISSYRQRQQNNSNHDNDEYNNETLIWDNNSSQSFQNSTHSSRNSSYNNHQSRTPPSPLPRNRQTINKIRPTINKRIQKNNNNTILTPENGFLNIFYIILFFCLICIIIIFMKNQMPQFIATVDDVIDDIPCDFDNLKKQFPQQNEFFWQSLQNGIENVFKHSLPTKLTVFLLAYNNHKKSTAELLIEQIVERTIECKDTTKRAVRLNQFDFQTPDIEADYGVAITKYRDVLNKHKIMVVKDFDKVPYKAAQAFHTICDTVTPLVKTSVIFLTMEIETNNTHSGDKSRNILEQVEEHLEQNWHDLNRNILQPLIARVTDQVLLIQ